VAPPLAVLSMPIKHVTAIEERQSHDRNCLIDADLPGEVIERKVALPLLNSVAALRIPMLGARGDAVQTDQGDRSGFAPTTDSKSR
jgi:hypothetical protein